MNVARIVKEPLHEIVYYSIKDRILDGTFVSGEKLSQDLLAQQLGVSRMPIRDALRMLENDGLIENTMHKGYVVSEFSKEHLYDILLVRNILEPQAVILSEKYLTDADKAMLKIIIEKAWDALEAHDPKKLQQLNENFHFTIYKSVPSPLLNEMIEKTWRSYPKYRDHLKYEESHESLLVHTEILDLMMENKFNEASQKMSFHILSHRK